ncbi:MFS transporter [Microtetraspora fusca]|uniref:MFS transporter n=1 Tax=Microtetraspora fusca TaxID=1997 RepID=UPI0008370091|nr:MFS transporter [Microtetraspora fusca]
MTSPRTESASPGHPSTGLAATSRAPAPQGRRAVPDRRVIAIVVGTNLAISLGYYAMVAHLVAHLHRDLGMLAGTVTAVLGVRVAVQYMLFLPVGALTDVIGPARAGALACALRMAAFALLGVTGGVGELLCAAVLMAVGGALFHPAAQSLLAGVAPARRSRGFAAYLISGELGAVVGPPVGLLLLLAGGFGLLSAVTAGAWAVGVVLFTLLRRAPGPASPTDTASHGDASHVDMEAVAEAAPPTGTGAARPDVRRIVAGVSAVLRDRGFLLFALAAAPITLLTSQVATVVPLRGVDAGTTTLFFSVVAVTTAAIQPWCAAAGRGERPWLLRSGLLCAGGGYLMLIAIPPAGAGRITVLVVAAVLHGLASGLTQAALFQTVTRCAPSGRFGAYSGLLNFLSGVVALAGSFAAGALFDAGNRGAATALAGLGLVAVVTAAAVRLPHSRVTRAPSPR